MARQTVTHLVDDIDGSELDEGGTTIVFGVDGRQYEIDLSDTHADELRLALAPYLKVARPVKSGGTALGTRRVNRTLGVARRTDLTEIREWARANGYAVSDRGRIAADVQSAYDQAH